jgi:hypothetical protein
MTAGLGQPKARHKGGMAHIRADHSVFGNIPLVGMGGPAVWPQVGCAAMPAASRTMRAQSGACRAGLPASSASAWGAARGAGGPAAPPLRRSTMHGSNGSAVAR